MDQRRYARNTGEKEAWDTVVNHTINTCFDVCIKSVKKELTNQQMQCVEKCSERYYETFVSMAMSG